MKSRSRSAPPIDASMLRPPVSPRIPPGKKQSGLNRGEQERGRRGDGDHLEADRQQQRAEQRPDHLAQPAGLDKPGTSPRRLSSPGECDVLTYLLPAQFWVRPDAPQPFPRLARRTLRLAGKHYDRKHLSHEIQSSDATAQHMPVSADRTVLNVECWDVL